MALRTAVPSVLCGVTSFGSARTAVVAAVAVEAAAVEVLGRPSPSECFPQDGGGLSSR
ncbi:hypothetical protein ABVT39_026260 [Epinephelus coioides]